MHRRDCRANKSCLGYWKRLLLDGLHITLEETIGNRSIAFCIAFQVTQLNLSIMRDLGICHLGCKAAFETPFASKRDLVIALVALRYFFHFIVDIMPKF